MQSLPTSSVALRRLVRSALPFVVLALGVLASPDLASAHRETISDGNDTPSRLDIRSAGTGHARGNVTHTITTFGAWSPGVLGPSTPNLFALELDTKGSATPERIVLVYSISGRMRAAVYTRAGRFIGLASASKPNGRSVKVSIRKNLLGKPAAYRWTAYSVYQGSGPCGRGCVDRAPRRGRVLHDLTPPKVVFPGARASRYLFSPLLPVPKATTYSVGFTVPDTGGSGLERWTLAASPVKFNRSWTQIGQGTTSAGSVSFTRSQGEGFEYRVTATDRHQNKATKSAILALPHDDVPCEFPDCDSGSTDFSGIGYSGTWTTDGASGDDYLGTLHTATPGAQFSFSFWGYVALVGPANCGRGTVTVGGRTHTVQAPCDGRRRVVLFEYANWSTFSFLRFTAEDSAFALDGVINLESN